jgi:Protein of unknown function (DUF998)
MSTTIERAPELISRAPTKSSHTRLVKVLLSCGIAYGVLYVVANDLIAATIYDGYNPIDQAISELSATEAPSRAFLTAMLPIFSLLVLGFGIGVWKSAGENRALRVTGGILMAQAVMFPLWLLAPMTSREELIKGTSGANDTGHLILSALAILLIVTEMGFAAAAFGKRFRLFSIAMVVTVLVFGALMGIQIPNVEAGDPTPWMGFVERISYGAWLLWMAVLAIVLLRPRGKEVPDANGQRND